MIKQVSRILYRPTEKLIIKLSVGLLDAQGNPNYYSLTEFQGYEYLTMNMNASIIIQYKSKTPIPWDSRQMVHINVNNIFRWRFLIKRFYESIIQTKDLFIYYNDGSMKYSGDESFKKSIPLPRNEFVELEPGLITDDKGEMFPGIYIRLNETRYEIELSMDEFEGFIYVFESVNINQEALELLLSKLLIEDKLNNGQIERKEEKKEEVKVFKPKGNVFDDKPIQEVIDNRPISVKTPKSVFDL